MRLRLAAFLAVVALPLAACGGDGGSETTSAWEGPPVPDAQGRLAVDDFNAWLADDADAVAGPIDAAITYVGLDAASAARKTVESRTEGEGGGATTVLVTLDGLFDDSVRAQRFELVLAQAGDGAWELRSAVATQRCHAGRGHQGFSAEPCL
jgi:hypothetical protein